MLVIDDFDEIVIERNKDDLKAIKEKLDSDVQVMVACKVLTHEWMCAEQSQTIHVYVIDEIPVFSAVMLLPSVGNNFTQVCLTLFLAVQIMIFESRKHGTSCSVYRYILTICQV